MFERDTPQSSHERLWREFRRLSEKLERLSEHQEDCGHDARHTHAGASCLEEEIGDMQRTLERMKASLREDSCESDCSESCEFSFGQELVCEIRQLREELRDWMEDATICDLDEKLDRCCERHACASPPPFPPYPPYPPFPPYPPYPPYSVCAHGGCSPCMCGRTQQPPATGAPCAPAPSSVSRETVPPTSPSSRSASSSSSAPPSDNWPPR